MLSIRPKQNWNDLQPVEAIRASGYLVSVCCGVEDREARMMGCDYSEINICPECKCICTFETETD